MLEVIAEGITGAELAASASRVSGGITVRLGDSGVPESVVFSTMTSNGKSEGRGPGKEL